MGHEAPKVSRQAFEGYMPKLGWEQATFAPARTPIQEQFSVFSARTPIQEQATFAPAWTPIHEQATLALGRRPIESTTQHKELNGEETATALDEILTAIIKHVLVEILVHGHGLGLLLKIMELVELYKIAVDEKSHRQANDRTA